MRLKLPDFPSAETRDTQVPQVPPEYAPGGSRHAELLQVTIFGSVRAGSELPDVWFLSHEKE